jgi:hypothetical protein
MIAETRMREYTRTVTITVERTVAITIVAQFFEITLSMILPIVAIVIAVTFLTISLIALRKSWPRVTIQLT